MYAWKTISFVFEILYLTAIFFLCNQVCEIY